MNIPVYAWAEMPQAHSAPGATEDLIRALDRNPSMTLNGLSMRIAAGQGISFVRKWSQEEEGTVSIPMPAGLAVGELRFALRAFSVPALILNILRQAEGRAMSADERAHIRFYRTEFADALINRTYAANLIAYLKTQPTWSAQA